MILFYFTEIGVQTVEMAKKRIDLSFLWRKKTYDQVSVQETNLNRVLGIFDVTCIGQSCLEI